MGDNMSPADLAAVVGNTDRNIAYPYPMYANNGFGNGFGADGSWIWFILILALFGGFGGNGWGNGGFGGGFNNEYAWLSNGQKEIMQNTTNGFDTLQLSNQLGQINTGVQGLATQLCGCCADVNSNLCNGFATTNQTINAGFANAEMSANARQIADMNQNFTNQLNLQNNLNQLNSRFSDCCCENRLGLANLNATILSENCADRQALSEGVRDIITNATSNTQRILDQLCQDKIDAKNEKIVDLQREILMKDLQASQVAQTADLRANNATVANQLVAELRSCPIPSQPVYGNQPIFTCNGNNGCGCGCNGYNGTL